MKMKVWETYLYYLYKITVFLKPNVNFILSSTVLCMFTRTVRINVVMYRESAKAANSMDKEITSKYVNVFERQLLLSM